NKTTNLTSKEAKMGKVMRHTLGASLNIRHNLSSSKGPKPLQLKLLTIIFIPKLRLILILNSFLGSSDSLVFSELFHSLAPRPLAARSISDFLLTYLAT